MKKLTTENFIEKAKKIHGNKYDYSKVKYVNNRTKVCIICPKHGEFWQQPGSHLKGVGCKKCFDEKRLELNVLTTEEFVKKAISIHGKTYDYSKTIYTGRHKKVIITCRKHGDFIQTPHSHLTGHGCPKCGYESSRNKQKTAKELFIEKARKIHGNKYDYSKVDYINNSTKVCIICPEHGEFWQRPNNHLNECGCPECGKNIIREKSRKNKEYFIKKAKQIHGDKYDYSKVEYHKAIERVCIICPEHGEFWQTPSNHLSGHECPICAQEKRLEKRRDDKNAFIEKARKIHGDNYDYSKVNYINSETKVCIICPEHGEFWVRPGNHINSRIGCPVCSESHLEKEVRTMLKNAGIELEGQKTFEWLRYENPLVLDFYLPEYNIAIECQGIQHYQPVGFGCKNEEKIQEMFELVRDRDKTKKILCEKHGIKILYYTKENVADSSTFTSVEDLKKQITR